MPLHPRCSSVKEPHRLKTRLQPAGQHRSSRLATSGQLQASPRQPGFTSSSAANLGRVSGSSMAAENAVLKLVGARAAPTSHFDQPSSSMRNAIVFSAIKA